MSVASVPPGNQRRSSLASASRRASRHPTPGAALFATSYTCCDVADDFLDLQLGRFLDLSAAEIQAPGAGSAAALTIALAASLVAKVARCSRDSWPDGAGIAAQALELRDRCPALARDDAEAWHGALAALAAAGDTDRRNGQLAGVLERAADLPLAIAEAGADVAGLARLAAERGDGSLRGEAPAAAVLAQAGVRAAAHLVVLNLATRAGDGRCARAERAERAAAIDAAAALAVES
jgi:methenyltetrahydrofolate cyclohydrolase